MPRRHIYTSKLYRGDEGRLFLQLFVEEFDSREYATSYNYNIARPHCVSFPAAGSFGNLETFNLFKIKAFKTDLI